MRKPSIRTASYLVVLLLAMSAPSLVRSQKDSDKWYGYYPESYARDTATRAVMPVYPEAAVSQRIPGVVQVKIAVNAQGEVVEMRMSPYTHPLLKKAVADAARHWTFKPRTDPERIEQLSMMHLTFRFSLRDGAAEVGMYDAGPTAPDSKRIGYLNSAKEAKEWSVWDDVPIEK